MNGDVDIRTGARNHRISIRIRPTGREARGPNGEIDISLASTKNWEVRCSPWAAVDETKGIELKRSEREVSELWTLFVMTYRADVPKPTDRIIWRGRVFDIISVIDVEGQLRRIDIQAMELKG